MRKFKKLITHPSIFFRDYLNKKYPVKNTEQPYTEAEEPIIIQSAERLNSIVARNIPGNFEIDVVFTWVDGADAKWRAKFNKYAPEYSAKSALFADDPARFTNHNELFFSVNSVLKFMPWVRHIFIVTDAQIPDWLDAGYSQKITVVDHKAIIDEAYLPTFNSHVIEAFLHRIPDLSENFIYFNDDVFVARQLQREHFFQNNGIASMFVSEKSLLGMKKRGVITPTLSASERSIDLLNQFYKTSIDTPLVHTYIPLKKSMYELAWQRYEAEIKAFLPNKLRTNQDLNFANFLIPWLMYFEGKAMPKMEICYYFNIRSPHALAQYKKLLHKKKMKSPPHSFCANDFNSKKCIPDYQRQLIKMLQGYYQ